MPAMRIVALAVALASGLGCKQAEPPPAAAPAELTGTFTVGAAPARLLACRPGHAVHVFVDIETSLGTLRFGEGVLRWDGAPLTCEKLDRRWGGGVRNDGSSYFRGTLDFRCGQLAGQLALDCGRITAGEASELERNAAAARTGRDPAAGSQNSSPPKAQP